VVLRPTYQTDRNRRYRLSEMARDSQLCKEWPVYGKLLIFGPERKSSLN
jgi:hypothetical protein